MALRVFPKLLYGEGHAYATPFTGSGTQASVSKIQRDDMKKFYETWFKADNATIIVVGDTTMAEIKPKIEKLLGDWKGGTVPKKNIANERTRSVSTAGVGFKTPGRKAPRTPIRKYPR